MSPPEGVLTPSSLDLSPRDIAPTRAMSAMASALSSRPRSRLLTIGITLSLGIHVVIAAYFITARFVKPEAIAFLDEALEVTMAPLSAAKPEPKEAPTPPKPTPVTPVESPIKPRVIDIAVPVEVATLAAPTPPAPPQNAPAAPALAAAVGEPFVPVDVDSAIESNPAPAYPPISRKVGEEGTVWLRLLVTDTGAVSEIQIKKSSGFSRLDTAAANAVKRWTFRPAKQNSKPVDSWINVPITFSLS